MTGGAGHRGPSTAELVPRVHTHPARTGPGPWAATAIGDRMIRGLAHRILTQLQVVTGVT